MHQFVYMLYAVVPSCNPGKQKTSPSVHNADGKRQALHPNPNPVLMPGVATQNKYTVAVY